LWNWLVSERLGALEAVIDHAARWFERYLAPDFAKSTLVAETENKSRGS
jgi:hypothetical protein